MKLLLDTHVWLWFEAEPRRLDTGTTQLLTDPANDLWLSVVSAWEFVLLAEKRRIALPQEPADWLRRCLGAGRYQIADLTLEIVLATRGVSVDSRDPADRLLASTARSLAMPLVTADRQLHSGTGYACRPISPRPR